MSGFLFEQVVFGPIKSRRLGISLGVNLLPLSRKACTFNCLYCECGWTKNVDDLITGSEQKKDSMNLPNQEGRDPIEGEAVSPGEWEDWTGEDFNLCRGGYDEMPGVEKMGYPDREIIRVELENKLSSMVDKRAMLTNITFAGNGEPTLHPDFEAIVEDTIALRNHFYPTASISVLSNASIADKESVIRALMKVDQNILKLDAGTNETFKKINNPRIAITLPEVIEKLKKFTGQMIIQTLFVKGSYRGIAFDNTTDAEIDAWLKHIEMLQPRAVMIYPIARETPIEDVRKISSEKLNMIARKVENLGVRTEVYN
jgi:wyosine [tRNA(Phe)-imidazoG37] synthetase (radical SAM superfamily)